MSTSFKFLYLQNRITFPLSMMWQHYSGINPSGIKVISLSYR